MILYFSSLILIHSNPVTAFCSFFEKRSGSRAGRIVHVAAPKFSKTDIIMND
jgi:hypothetical protein